MPSAIPLFLTVTSPDELTAKLEELNEATPTVDVVAKSTFLLTSVQSSSSDGLSDSAIIRSPISSSVVKNPLPSPAVVTVYVKPFLTDVPDGGAALASYPP